MQVYKSALVFIPTCALLEAYKHELPAVHMTSPRTKNWDASLLVLEGHKSTVNMVSFSPKGGRAASASDDGYLYIWDTANGAQVNSLFGHDGAVKSVEYSPDASFLVSGGSDAAIRIWDAVTGAHIFTLIGHKGGVNAAIYSGDGRKIASGSDDETVGIWDAMPNKQLASLHGHSGPVTCLAFLTEDSHVLSGSMDATIRLWDTRTKNTLRVLQCPDAVLSLYVYTSLQNSAIISGSQNGVITIRDGTTLEETGLFFGSAAAVKSLSASSQVNKVVSGLLGRIYFASGTMPVDHVLPNIEGIPGQWNVQGLHLMGCTFYPHLQIERFGCGMPPPRVCRAQKTISWLFKSRNI